MQPVVLNMDQKAKYVTSGCAVELDTKKNLTVETLATFAPQIKETPVPVAVPNAK
jgi:hypothetical protein